MSDSELLFEIKNLKKMRNERAQVWRTLNRVYEEAKPFYNQVTIEDDDRLNPKKAIDFSAKHLAQVCIEAEKEFGGRKVHKVISWRVKSIRLFAP